jgi:hypothetical protein
MGRTTKQKFKSAFRTKERAKEAFGRRLSSVIDQLNTAKDELPYGMNTFLYQAYDRSDQHRLYIKTETEGARFFPNIFDKQARENIRGKGSPTNRMDTPASRKLKGKDVSDSIKHGLNIFKGRADALGRHGEKFSDLSSETRDGFKELLRLAHRCPDPIGTMFKSELLEGTKLDGKLEDALKGESGRCHDRESRTRQTGSQRRQGGRLPMQDE